MKTKIKSDSVAIKILRAAISLSEGGVGAQIFSANDLVMRAWEMYPIDFSIHPHPHPDSNRVLSACMGKRGLVSLGFLRLVSPKVYAVTEAGYARAPSAGHGGARRGRAGRGSARLGEAWPGVAWLGGARQGF